MTTIYPEYKNAAKLIYEGDDIFYSDEDLSLLLDAQKGTDSYKFRLLHLVKHLIEDYGIDFIRSENEFEGKGYKIATDSESLSITVQRLTRKVSNTTRKQALVLNKIEPCNLVEHEKGIYDHNVVRNGMLSALISKTNKMTLIPGATVRIDIPRVIPCD